MKLNFIKMEEKYLSDLSVIVNARKFFDSTSAYFMPQCVDAAKAINSNEPGYKELVSFTNDLPFMESARLGAINIANNTAPFRDTLTEKKFIDKFDEYYAKYTNSHKDLLNQKNVKYPDLPEEIEMKEEVEDVNNTSQVVNEVVEESKPSVVSHNKENLAKIEITRTIDINIVYMVKEPISNKFTVNLEISYPLLSKNNGEFVAEIIIDENHISFITTADKEITSTSDFYERDIAELLMGKAKIIQERVAELNLNDLLLK